VYYRRDRIGGARMAKAYRGGPEFFRVLSVLRGYQSDAARAEYPLFTLRGFLAAQVESLSGFVGELKIGNCDSEKARSRYDEWYLYRYYELELVKKGLARPSDNNPVTNRDGRLDHERARVARGVLPADHAFPGEAPVQWLNRPALYYEVAPAAPLGPSEAKIELPPGMDLCQR
jgi:hypothetical protein